MSRVFVLELMVDTGQRNEQTDRRTWRLTNTAPCDLLEDERMITVSTVTLHCCKAHERINRKMGNSTLCEIVTPEIFSSKVCSRDYVRDGNYCAIFC